MVERDARSLSTVAQAALRRRAVRAVVENGRTQAEVAELYWVDEMRLRSNHAAGRSYSPKGKMPVVRGPGQRFGCNQVSAITNRGRLHFMVFQERFTTCVFLDFLRRRRRQPPMVA